jgi:hypothetical protein
VDADGNVVAVDSAPLTSYVGESATIR